MMYIPDLKLIEERFINAVKDSDEFKFFSGYPQFLMYTFPQWWGSTALGFDGMGGSAMTRAYTTVIENQATGWTGVFFGEKLAYTLLSPNEEFYKDLNERNMAPVSESGKYENG